MLSPKKRKLKVDFLILDDNNIKGLCLTSGSEGETFALGKSMAEYLKKKAPERNSPFYVSLTGEMGCGKTAFVKGVIAGLGYAGNVTSPTFALCNKYSCDLTVYHMDLYRISDEDELFAAGLLDNDDADAVFAEWAEIAEGSMPFDLYIRFSYGTGVEERIIEFT